MDCGDPEGCRQSSRALPAARDFRRHILELAQQVRWSGSFGPAAPAPALRREPAAEIDCGGLGIGPARAQGCAGKKRLLPDDNRSLAAQPCAVYQLARVVHLGLIVMEMELEDSSYYRPACRNRIGVVNSPHRPPAIPTVKLLVCCACNATTGAAEETLRELCAESVSHRAFFSCLSFYQIPVQVSDLHVVAHLLFL